MGRLEASEGKVMDALELVPDRLANRNQCFEELKGVGVMPSSSPPPEVWTGYEV